MGVGWGGWGVDSIRFPLPFALSKFWKDGGGVGWVGGSIRLTQPSWPIGDHPKPIPPIYNPLSDKVLRLLAGCEHLQMTVPETQTIRMFVVSFLVRAQDRAY